MSPTDGLLKFNEKHLDRLRDAASRVRDGRDIEAVHTIRVSSRRLTEPLQLMAEFVSKQKCGRARDELKRLRGALRVVRDVDVLRMALAEQGDATVSDPEAQVKLQAVLAIQREAELVAARRQIAKLNPKELRRAIQSLGAAFQRKTAERDSRVLREAKRLWKHKAEALLDRAPTREHGPGVHKTRIRLKALRYSTELMSRLDGVDRSSLLEQFSAMQDRLGAWNDHFCAARLLAELARDEDTLAGGPGWSAGVLQYAAKRAGAMEQELEEILIGWPRLRTAIEREVLGRVQSEEAAAPRFATAIHRLAAGRA